MKDGWQSKRIGDLCKVIAGQSPPGRFYNPEGEGMPFYQGKKDFGEKFIQAPTVWTTQTTKVAQEGDILMSVRAPVGPVNFASNELCIGRGLAAIRCGADLSHEFLYYQLVYLQREIAGRDGAVFASISKAAIEDLSIAFVPLREQQRIVGFLDEAFDGIASAKANAEKNIKAARAIFDSHLESVFTERGQGWVDTHKSLADLCELIVDCEHKTAPTQERGIPSIRTPNIGKGKLLLDGVNRVSEETYRAWTRRAEPRPGDLILAREAPAGNVAVIPDGLRVCLGQRTVLIRPRADVFEPAFLSFLLLEADTQRRLLAHSRGATVEHVNMRDIRALRVGAIPPLDEQRVLTSRLEAVSTSSDRLVGIYEQKLGVLEALKMSLLNQAFTGQLGVSAA